MYYISFRKGDIRVEWVIPGKVAVSRHEARTIAEREARQLEGYRFEGVQ